MLTEAPETIKTQVLALPEQARHIVIETNEQYASAGRFLLRIKDIRAKIAAWCDPVITAAFETHTRAIAQKREIEQPLIVAEGIIKPRIAGFLRQQEEERLERERKEQEEAEQLLEQPVEVLPVVLPETTPKVSGIATREIWKFRIIDERAIPREYLMPDLVRIGQVVRALKNQVNIPGVQAYKEDVIAAGMMR